MDQLELDLGGDLQPIQNWLHVWDEARREAVRKKAPAQGQGRSLPKQAGGEVKGEHQAASLHVPRR